MSLLDEYMFDNKSSLEKNINKDLDDIDNLIIDISRHNCESELFKINNNIFILNYFLFLTYILHIKNYNDKQLVVYNKYGFDNGYNLYSLYAYILDIYVRFIINHSYLYFSPHSCPS